MSQPTVLPTDFTPPEACPAQLPPDLGPAHNSHRCQFCFADGRSCRMLRWRKHRLYCLPHAREEERLLAVDQVACELASLSGEFNTVSDINHVLGKVFTLLAHNRISRRDAIAYAYIGQLLLQTIPNVKDEVCEVLGRNAWKEKLQDALCAPVTPQVNQADRLKVSQPATQDAESELSQPDAQLDEPDVRPEECQASEQDVVRADDQPGEELEQPESAQEMLQPEEFAPPRVRALLGARHSNVPQAPHPKTCPTPTPTNPPAESAPAPAPKPAAKTKKRIRSEPEPREEYYTDEWGARYRVYRS